MHVAAAALRLEVRRQRRGYLPDLNAPFGGVKASGLGREMGPESVAAYQQLKSIYQMG